MYKTIARDKGGDSCKGLRFRATQGFYVTDFGFEEKRGFKLLKRQSCTGCAVCTHTWDFVKEVLTDYDDLPIEENRQIDVGQDYGVKIYDEDVEFYPVGPRIYK